MLAFSQIDDILETGFDDISAISDDCRTLSDDDDDFIKSDFDFKSKLHQMNGCASTPVQHRNHDFGMKNGLEGIYKSSGNRPKQYDSNKNWDTSTVADEEQRSSISYSNDGMSQHLTKMKEKCLEMSHNYDVLQDDFEELHQVNGKHLETIARLESKVGLLEKQLSQERHAKESFCKKVMILESTVESLEYQIAEFHKSDFITKTNQDKDKLITNLKLRHNEESLSLKNQIDYLNKIIQDKDDVIRSKNNIIARYESDSSEEKVMAKVKEAVQAAQTKVIKEMQSKFETETKAIKEKVELNLLESFDKSIEKLKEEWQTKLDEDIGKVTEWIGQLLTNVDVVSDASLLGLDIKYSPLFKLCLSLKHHLVEHENNIKMQTEKLKDAKFQLEQALIETRMSSSSLSNSSDKSNLMEELNKVKEESQSMAHKLHKYKQHYRLLMKTHQAEIESLKQDFRSRLEQFRRENNPR